MVSTERLRVLAQSIKPVITEIDLIRIGAEEDGGYLIPNDLEGIETCFSPGVDKIASFEAGLLKYGIGSHLADFSVDGVPEGVPVATFIKKYIGANNNDKFISMESWINGIPDLDKNKDLILQMDIEGGEYETILSMPVDILRRFRIAVIEFHNIETWSQSHYLSIVEAVFEKIQNIFHVVHSHPNNAMGIVDMNGFLAPRVFEMTLLRKDRAVSSGKFSKLPNNLDRKNLKDREEISFPADWR